VPDKDVVLDNYSLADKGMTGYLATLPDVSVLLDLHECADPGFVADLTSIHIDKL
jgi:hypothetical protein